MNSRSLKLKSSICTNFGKFVVIKCGLFTGQQKQFERRVCKLKNSIILIIMQNKQNDSTQKDYISL